MKMVKYEECHTFENFIIFQNIAKFAKLFDFGIFSKKSEATRDRAKLTKTWDYKGDKM